VEVVKQQLFVHAGAAGNPGHARAFETAPRELLAGCGDDS
jgi:hypothetical protein